jgi:hypothetical protein
MRRRPVLVVLGSCTLAFAAVVACGSSAQGVDACKTIEHARCGQIPSCPNVTVSPPIWYTSGSAVDACNRYYDTACAHGLSIGSNPSTSDVNQCVDAITSGDCSVVATPWSNASCVWLIPPADEDDAGDGGDATDASDAGDGTDGEGGE